MKTPICPTCGCSLVRLGIRTDQATVFRHGGEDLSFCCQGCVDVFLANPAKAIEETKDLIVCPTCLAEKPLHWAVEKEIDGEKIHFCRCPYCENTFRKNPEYYRGRLEGSIESEGVLDHEGCCIRPS